MGFVDLLSIKAKTCFQPEVVAVEWSISCSVLHLFKTGRELSATKMLHEPDLGRAESRTPETRVNCKFADVKIDGSGDSPNEPAELRRREVVSDKSV